MIGSVKRHAASGILFIIVLLLYASSMGNGFVYDDHEVIQAQPIRHSAFAFVRIFAEPHFPGLPYYRPVTRLTLLLQKSASGDHPLPFHLANALLIAFAACAAYGLLRLPVFALSNSLAWFAAALFAVHPIASSCVYPISSGRETLLPSTLTVLAVAAFVKGGKWYWPAVMLFALALFSKEQAAITPGLLLLADLLEITTRPARMGWRRWFSRYAPIAAILAFYFACRYALFGGAEYLFGRWQGPLLSYGFGLQAIFAPFWELRYEPTVAAWLSPPRLMIAASLALLLCVAAARNWRRREIRFWVGWYILAQLPTANLLRQEARFDERYLFLASIAVFACTAALLQDCQRTHRHLIALAACALLALYTADSLHRRTYFSDDITFSRQWIQTDPGSVNAHYNLAYALERRNDPTGAENEYLETLRLRPDYAAAHNNLANLLVARGDFTGAVAHFQAAIRLQPDYNRARRNLGLALARQGKLTEAIAQFEEALDVELEDADLETNLATALALAGQPREAVRHFSLAIRIRPDSAEAHNNLANALAAEGDLDASIQEYRTALRLLPGYAAAEQNLTTVEAERQQRHP